MDNELWPEGEYLPTLTAGVGLFSRVHPLMSIKVWLGTECPFTFGAFVRPLSRMNSEMDNQLWLTTKSFPTFITHTVLFYTMSSLMLKKIGFFISMELIRIFSQTAFGWTWVLCQTFSMCVVLMDSLSWRNMGSAQMTFSKCATSITSLNIFKLILIFLVPFFPTF